MFGTGKRAFTRGTDWATRRRELRMQRALDRRHRDTKEALLLGQLKARAGGADVPDELVAEMMMDWLIIDEATGGDA